MTEPTDEDLLETFQAACDHGDRCNQGHSYARAQALRAVLAKWGTPTPVGAEPVSSADGPKELWLQLHGDCLPHEQSEPVDYASDGVTWCWHGVYDSDVRYVREDLVADQVLAMGQVLLSDDRLLLERRFAISSLFHLIDRWAGEKLQHYQLMNELGQIVDHVIRRTEEAHGIKQGGQHAE